MDPSVIKVPSVITFGPKRNKSPIRNNILNPSVIKVLSVMTFGPKRNKAHKGVICWPFVPAEIILYETCSQQCILIQGWHHGSCDQTEPEKHEGKKIPPNLAMPLGLRFDKFITGYETCFSKNSSLQNK